MAASISIALRLAVFLILALIFSFDRWLLALSRSLTKLFSPLWIERISAMHENRPTVLWSAIGIESVQRLGEIPMLWLWPMLPGSLSLSVCSDVAGISAAAVAYKICHPVWHWEKDKKKGGNIKLPLFNYAAENQR